MGFLIRWVAAFVLLAATFNPTGMSYVHWARESWSENTSIIVLAGLVLAVAFIVFALAVLRGIGVFGVFLIVAVLAAFVWVLVDMEWINLDNPGVVTWVVLIGASVVLAAGMYWGILWRRISGQIEVDDEGDA